MADRHFQDNDPATEPIVPANVVFPAVQVDGPDDVKVGLDQVLELAAPLSAGYIQTLVSLGIPNGVALGDMITIGLAAALPSPFTSFAGQVHFATDEGKIYRFSGADWEVALTADASGTFAEKAGDNEFTGTNTFTGDHATTIHGDTPQGAALSITAEDTDNAILITESGMYFYGDSATGIMRLVETGVFEPTTSLIDTARGTIRVRAGVNEFDAVNKTQLDGTAVYADGVVEEHVLDDPSHSADKIYFNATGTGLTSDRVQAAIEEVYDASIVGPQTVNTYAADHTLGSSDVRALAEHDDVIAHAFTVPANATTAIAIGQFIDLANWSSGLLSIIGAVGVTVKCPTGYALELRAEGSMATLFKRALNEWYLTGDLSPA